MTYYEMIKQSSLEGLAGFLCRMCAECKNCPASNLCYKGHNGMIAWLKKERGDDE